MNAKETLNKIKVALGMEVSLEQMTLDNGTIIEADAFAPDNEVFILSNGERVALPVGEYTLENGQVLVVQEEGIIASIQEAMPEQEAAPEPENQPEMEAEPQQATTPKKVVESISKEMHFAKEIENLKKEIELLKAEKAELSKDKPVEEVEVEMAQVVEPKKHNPESKPERKLIMHSQSAPKSTFDRVLAKMCK